MDLNEFQNNQTSPEAFSQAETELSQELKQAAGEAADAAQETAKEAAETAPQEALNAAEAAAEAVSAPQEAPTPETMRQPDPADYGWQSVPQQTFYPQQQFYPQAGYPQQGYPPQQTRQVYGQQGFPQQPYASQPVYGQQAYGYRQNPAPAQNPYLYRAPVYNNAPPAAPAAPKTKTRGATKAIFAVIIGLVIASLGFFVGYVIRDSRAGNSGPDLPNVPEWNLPNPAGPEESRPEESRPDNGEPSDPEPAESKPEREYEVIPNTEGIKLNELPAGEDRSAKDIYAEIKNSIVGVIVEKGTVNESQGSGIIATEDGYIITNAHVVLNRRSVDVEIVTLDEASYEAVVVGFDKTTDLAVLKVVGTADTFEPAAFGDSDSLSVGDWVLAIGNPGGQDFASSLTRGIVSAVNRKVGTNSSSGMTYIQTDAAINPGNSGGALVNMAGQVVGINSSKIVAADYEGMGFAIPITQAKAIIDDLMANGYVVGRARLGIRGRNVTAYAATLGGIPQGFEIMEFPEESPFLSVDAKVGDIITAIDGETVSSLTDITNILARHSPGDRVEISLYRYEGLSEPQTITVTVTLLEDKGETQE